MKLSALEGKAADWAASILLRISSRLPSFVHGGLLPVIREIAATASFRSTAGMASSSRSQGERRSRDLTHVISITDFS